MRYRVPGMNNFYSVIAKLDYNNITENISDIELYRQSVNDDNIHKFTKDANFCCFIIEKDNIKYLKVIVSIISNGSPNGSSNTTVTVMNVLDLLERVMLPYDTISSIRDIGKNKTVIHFLTCTKKIRKEDII